WAAPTPSMTRRGLLGLLIGSTSGFFLGRATAPAALDHPGDGDLGLVYHAWSRPSAPRLLDAITDWGVRPEATKTYPEAERVQLPSPVAAPALSAFAAIGGRRSVRDYATAPMPLGDLSRLLHLAGGITQPGGSAGLRAAPSAGALYPIETYVIAHTVGDLAPGLYHYTVVDHALERLQSDDLRQACVRLGAMQGFLGEANAVFVLTAVFQRLRWRYHRRGYRYALLEAGHIGQNLYLAATAMGMGACAVGAFLDDGLNDLLQIDGVKEAALYMLSVGRR
ncbi:MAG: SagB/ThcOx family dehydrogenase, partial [Anaerolineae bacterium]|nr:SagB/ThcOx family dehydrogenase [Anaerolineae bacterium]